VFAFPSDPVRRIRAWTVTSSRIVWRTGCSSPRSAPSPIATPRPSATGSRSTGGSPTERPSTRLEAREQPQPLIERDATLQEMADELGRSMSTVRYWLNELGLKTTGRRGRRPAVPRVVIDQAIDAGARTVMGRCRWHGEGVFVIENSGRARCRKCRMDAVTEWRRRKKSKLVEEAGGRCALCGYDRCDAALQFHHLDPASKSFALSMRGVTRSMAVCRAEAAKCVLLCANCHAEVEVGFSTV
jgi:hypothetical protein